MPGERLGARARPVPKVMAPHDDFPPMRSPPSVCDHRRHAHRLPTVAFPMMTRLGSTFIALITLTFLWTIPGTAAAQDRTPRAGIIVTLAHASLDWSSDTWDAEPYRVRRLGGGVTFELPLTDGLSIEARALFTQRGGNTISPSHRGVTARITTRELTAPVMLKLGKRTGPYVAGGLELSHRIGVEYRLDGTSRAYEGDIDDILPRRDINVIFGAGFGMKYGFVEVMYSLGRRSSEIFADDIPLFEADASFRTRALTLGVGVRF